MVASIEDATPIYTKTVGRSSFRNTLALAEPLKELSEQVKTMKYSTPSELKGLEKTLTLLN